MVAFGALGSVWERLLPQHIYVRDPVQVEGHALRCTPVGGTDVRSLCRPPQWESVGQLVSLETEAQPRSFQVEPCSCFPVSVFGETNLPLSKQPGSSPGSEVSALWLPSLEPESPNSSGAEPCSMLPGSRALQPPVIPVSMFPRSVQGGCHSQGSMEKPFTG